MSHTFRDDPPNRLTLQLTESGYLRISRDEAESAFPSGTAVAVLRDRQLTLLPTRGDGTGGLIWKYRNSRGDRSLFVGDLFGAAVPAGRYQGRWDAVVGGFHVSLQEGTCDGR
ncbi:MAG: hypothetical protein KDA61_20635 [Planctomycetales bacterium]|nr:hypothetical protein [Planctomycetales bacterium]